MAKRYKGSIRDFTTGNEGRQIFHFAVPIIIGSMLMQLYNYADSVIVGRYLGKEALAAVGASAPVVFLIVSMIVGIGMGTTIMISQFYGQRQYKKIRLAANSLYVFLFFAAIVVSALGILFSESIMRLIRLPENILPYATDYLDIYMLGLVFLFGFNSLQSILRGLGDSKSPLVFLIISAVLNIALDLLFIVKFGWGIKGAAWATIVSEAIAVIFAIWYTNVHNPILKFNFFKIKFNRKIFLQSFKLGLPAGFQQTFLSIGMIAIMGAINSFGTDVIAGYTGASRIDSLLSVIPMNLALALTSFTGQNLGAGKFDRVRRGIRATLKMSVFSCLMIFLVLLVSGKWLMAMFLEGNADNLAVIQIGYQYLLIVGGSYVLFAIMFTFTGVIRGAGETVIPMLITLFALWLIRVPLAYLFAGWWGYVGIWWSLPFSWSAGALATVIYYKTGRWKRKIMSRKPLPKENFTTFEASN